MARSTFVYVTYIRTTPEKLWSALTDAEFMKQYWFGMHCEKIVRAAPATHPGPVAHKGTPTAMLVNPPKSRTVFSPQAMKHPVVECRQQLKRYQHCTHEEDARGD